MLGRFMKVKCPRCGFALGGEYREGTQVYCNKCSSWINVEKEKKPCQKE